jgi:hypothetical protein
MTARFGSSLPEKADNSVRTRALFSNPTDCCSPSTSQVLFLIFSPTFKSSSTVLSVLCFPLFAVI